jgi:hypothetical protein
MDNYHKAWKDTMKAHTDSYRKARFEGQQTCWPVVEAVVTM